MRRPHDAEAKARPTGLVVDRDPAVRTMIREGLERRGARVLGAETGGEAVELLRSEPIDLLLIDPAAPGVRQSGLVETAVGLREGPLLVGLHADGAVEQGESWLARIQDVADARTLGWLLDCVVSHWRVVRDCRQLQRRLRESEGYEGILGRSDAMQAVRDAAHALADGSEPVWISGPKGADRKTIAMAIHRASGNGDGSLVRLDCGALNEGGADPISQAGGGALAASGTVYLESPEKLDARLQRDLLNALQAGAVPARLIIGSAETPRSVREGGVLLPDLVDRLANDHVAVPPLRARREDVPLLARRFLEEIADANFMGRLQLDPDALALLERHDWPGEVVELRHALEHAAILAEDGRIRPSDLPGGIRRDGASSHVSGEDDGVTFREAKREVVSHFERGYLRALLERHRGNVTSAAQQAGMLRSALQRLLRKYGIRSSEYRRARTAGRPAGPENDATL